MSYIAEYNGVEIAKLSYDRHTIKSDNRIQYIDIESYNSERSNTYEPTTSYLIKLLEQASEDNKNIKIHDNVNYSLLEVLTDDEVRMYFDIKNIPKDNKEMIYEIIDKIYEIMKLEYRDIYKSDTYTNYTLTVNNNSHHEKLSYHLFLPIVSTKTDIYNFVKLFNYRTDYKYVNMIDCSVYGENVLFRTVGSRRPSNSNKSQFTPRNQEDYHKLIKGRLYDSIIQNYNKLNLVFKCELSEIFDDFNNKINKVKNQILDEIKTKLITQNDYHNQNFNYLIANLFK